MNQISSGQVRICCFTKVDGEICGSPAQRGQTYCYHHNREFQRICRLIKAAEKAEPVADPFRARALRHIINDLHIDFYSADSIRASLVAVTKATATRRIDPRNGALLQYSLQIAAMNLRN